MKDIFSDTGNTIAFWTLVVSIIGILVAFFKDILLNFFRKKKKPVFFNNFPKVGNECIGRSAEINQIRDKLLKYESVFIHGTAGIGKTTLAKFAIKGIEEELINKGYDALLYYNFSENPSLESAINSISSVIPNSAAYTFQYLINNKKYIICLDECEKTNCLDDFIKLSDNPVFIICSRNDEQIRALQKYGNVLDVSLTSLTEKDALKLLTGNIRWNPFSIVTNRINNKINNSIIQYVGRHPFNIFNIKNNRLYKKNPKDFFNLLIKEGLDSPIDKGNPIIHQEGFTMKVLLKMNLGIEIQQFSDSFSKKTRTALGFLGFIAHEPYAYNFLDNLFDKKVIKELKKTKLFYINKKYGVIYARHSAVHEVLQEYSNQLLGNNYETIIYFLAIFNLVYTNKREEYSNDLFNLADTSNYVLLNHIYYCVKNLISQHPKELKDHIMTLIISLFSLSTYGIYKEVLLLMDELVKTNIELDSSAQMILNTTRYTSYEGLEIFDKCIECMNVELLSGSNPEDIVSSKDNIIDAYINKNELEKAQKELSVTKKYIEDNLDYLSDIGAKEVLLRILLREQKLKWCLIANTNTGLDDYITDQLELMKLLLDNYPYDDFIYIRAHVLLFFALLKNKNEKAFTSLALIINSLNNWKQSPGYFFILYKIVVFLFKEGYSEKSHSICEQILYECEAIYGKENVITNRIRNKFFEITEQNPSDNNPN